MVFIPLTWDPFTASIYPIQDSPGSPIIRGSEEFLLYHPLTYGKRFFHNPVVAAESE